MNDMTKIKNLTFIQSYNNLASDDYCNRMVARFEELANNSSLIQTSLNSGTEQYGAKIEKTYLYFFLSNIIIL